MLTWKRILLPFVVDVLAKLSCQFCLSRRIFMGFFLTSLKHWTFQWNCRLQELDYVRRGNREEKKGCGEEN